MSSWTNGDYVPEGADFTEWTEYLKAKNEAEEYQDYLDDMEEEEELNDEKDLKLSVSAKDYNSAIEKADSLISGVKESISGSSKKEKLETLNDLQEQTHTRLLYEHLRKDPFSTDFIFKTNAESTAEEEKRFFTFSNINKVLKAETFDFENKDLRKALNFYDEVLKNEPWAKAEAESFEKWKNGQGGNIQTVYSRLLDQKLEAMKETVSQEPEPQKKKAHRRDMDWER